MRPRAGVRWSVSIALAVVASFLSKAPADDVFTTKDVAPKESYELHFLGCKLEGDPTSTKRLGVFQLIWTADEPTKLLVGVSPDGKKVVPVTDFVVHIATGTIPFKGIYPLPP